MTCVASMFCWCCLRFIYKAGFFMEVNILGFEVSGLNPDQCCRSILSKIEKGEAATWLACFNPHSYAESLKDSAFTEALRSADWLVPDGAGVVIASRMLGGSISDRVTGSDIFYGLHNLMNNSGGKKVFFLGSTEENLVEIRKRMANDYPNIEVVGTYSPPFKSEYSRSELNAMIMEINSAAPDVLWVGMTAPKQEKWIFENLPDLDVRFAGAIGAVFDFYTGRVKRSHPVFQRLGLEWLPRLLQQPRRLWRRMFVSAPIFMWNVLKKKYSQRRD